MKSTHAMVEEATDKFCRHVPLSIGDRDLLWAIMAYLVATAKVEVISEINASQKIAMAQAKREIRERIEEGQC